MSRLLEVTILLILATFAPGVMCEVDKENEIVIATQPEECTISTLGELLTFARSTLDLARSDLNFAQQELTAERTARREEMKELREELMAERQARIEQEAITSEQVAAERTARIVQMNQLRNETTTLRQKMDRFNSVAFHATLTVGQNPLIPREGKVKFNTVRLNNGNGYDKTTGVFTVPSGGAGLYYIHTHLYTQSGEKGNFILERNGQRLCALGGDNLNAGANFDTGTCAATVELNAGDRVYVKRHASSDNTPLLGTASYCGFTGFLMKPAE